MIRVSALEEALPVMAAFGNRETAFPPGDGPAGRVGSRWRVTSALATAGLPSLPAAAVSQVHGAQVLEVTGSAWPAGEADAIFTTRPDLALVIRTADCVPVLLACPRGVMAVHAGWRGTALGVLEAALGELLSATGCRPDEVLAAIGPAIGPCCYRVGEEVVDRIGALIPRAVFAREGAGGSLWVDLQAANGHVLRSMGVSHVVVRRCTSCDPSFHSHRRDGARAGRQLSMVALVHGPLVRSQP